MASVLGIDIGGTGIKAAPVDVEAGRLLAERLKLPTPHPAAPEPMAKAISQLVEHFAWQGPIGVTFPGVVTSGTIRTAANLDHSWIDTDAVTFLGKATGQPVTVINDADAAGIAEMRFGAGKSEPGTVLLLTLGTGIGSAVVSYGALIPFTEFGNIVILGWDAETRASERAREEDELSWGKWADRLDEYLDKMEGLLWPNLIIIGGGISKKSEKFLPKLSLRARIVPAGLLNDAGIVGAAMAASAEGIQP
jgi:polyphosphate glucokinase